MSKMTPKQKEMYFRLSYDYWMEWKTRPDEEKSPLERLGCYVNVFSMMENRLRVLYWTSSFYEGFESVLVDPKKNEWKTISRKQYEKYSDYPYTPNTPSPSISLKHILNRLKTRLLLSKTVSDELNEIMDFRNDILHTSMFQMDKVKDEHIDKVMSGFRHIDRTLKFRRRTYMRMEKELQQKKK